MTESDNLEAEASDNLEAEAGEETSEAETETTFANDEKPYNGRRELGLLPILGLFLLAAALGAIGGAYGTHYLFPPASVEDLRADVQKDVAQIDAKTQTDMDGIRQEMTKLKKISSRANSDADFKRALNAIDQRLEAVESLPSPNLPEISPETIAALKAAQADGFDWPETDSINTQISELTSKTEALESQIKGLNGQIGSLEAVLKTQAARPEMRPAGIVKPRSPDFPKQALLNAANTRSESQGFLSRTLNKHVSVDLSLIHI